MCLQSSGLHVALVPVGCSFAWIGLLKHFGPFSAHTFAHHSISVEFLRCFAYCYCCCAWTAHKFLSFLLNHCKHTLESFLKQFMIYKIAVEIRVFATIHFYRPCIMIHFLCSFSFADLSSLSIYLSFSFSPSFFFESIIYINCFVREAKKKLTNERWIFNCPLCSSCLSIHMGLLLKIVVMFAEKKIKSLFNETFLIQMWVALSHICWTSGREKNTQNKKKSIQC